MRLLWQGKSYALAWWWVMLALVTAINIALLVALWRQSPSPEPVHAAGLGADAVLALCAAYVFGCAFRALLPRADVQRICLFDTWLSSVVIGRTVATVAELCFAAQWSALLLLLGWKTETALAIWIGWTVVPFIFIAQCCSWYGVLTTNTLANAIENAIWAVVFSFVAIGLCSLLPNFSGLLLCYLLAAIAGIAGFVVFVAKVDVPMYLRRWKESRAHGQRHLRPLEGLRDVSTRWTVTHDVAHWRDEITWMSLYFSVAVWASLALCQVYWLGLQMPSFPG